LGEKGKWGEKRGGGVILLSVKREANVLKRVETERGTEVKFQGGRKLKIPGNKVQKKRTCEGYRQA